MARDFYDIVIIGGGLGGAALGKVMAGAGYRALVIEREQEFRDRVRGEGLHPWGVPEARRLGIYDTLLTHCAVEAQWWDFYLGTEQISLRNYPETTPHGSPLVAFSHPEMQEALLRAAGDDGAEIWRGAKVRDVRGGEMPVVTVAREEWVSEIEAKLVVGADGRNSATRRRGGFTSQQDPSGRLFTGVLLGNVDVPEDTWIAHMNPQIGTEAMLCNIGQGRARAYLGHPRSAGYSVTKQRDFPEFVRACVETGAPASLYADASVEGPMGSFGTEDVWVAHPYNNGIALVGDAASTCDPSFGQGMALTLRGVRILAELLKSEPDWHKAGHEYARAQNREFRTIHTIEGWYRSMFLETGAEADEQRARALPLLAGDPSRDPDLFGLGPEARSDEYARQRYFGFV